MSITAPHILYTIYSLACSLQWIALPLLMLICTLRPLGIQHHRDMGNPTVLTAFFFQGAQGATAVGGERLVGFGECNLPITSFRQ